MGMYLVIGFVVAPKGVWVDGITALGLDVRQKLLFEKSLSEIRMVTPEETSVRSKRDVDYTYNVTSGNCCTESGEERGHLNPDYPNAVVIP